VTIFYRRLPPFDYLRPRTLAEAIAALSELEPVRNQVFSGGTDLLPKLKSRAINAPPQLIDLKGIPGLDGIEFSPEQGLRIGANAIIREVAKADSVNARYTALAQGSSLIASNQLQHRGTIVGNICNAVPSADSAPALLAHRANVVCTGPAGDRIIPLFEFFVSAGVTVLQPREIVSEIRVPPPIPGERSVYLKLAPRGRMDLAMVGVAATLVIEDGLVRHATIGLGSAAPIPVRAVQAEQALVGQRISSELIEHAAALAREHSNTRSSHRASGGYRKEMIGLLTRRALTQLAQGSNARPQKEIPCDISN
jgi:CO/xanthine dehydrogenase FAD-binding subunit